MDGADQDRGGDQLRANPKAAVVLIVAGVVVFVTCGWINQAETNVEKMFDAMGTYFTGPALMVVGILWLWLTRNREG